MTCKYSNLNQNSVKTCENAKLTELYELRFKAMLSNNYDEAERIQEQIENMHTEIDFLTKEKAQIKMENTEQFTESQHKLKEALVNYKIKYGSLKPINLEVGTTYSQLNSFIAMSSKPTITTFDLIMKHIQNRNGKGNQ